MWSVDHTTSIVRGAIAPAERRNQLQQLPQTSEAKLTITAQLLAGHRPISVCPAPGKLQRRAIRKPHHHTRLAGRQNLKLSTLQWMVAPDDGYFGGNMEKEVLGLRQLTHLPKCRKTITLTHLHAPQKISLTIR